jgi:hypothetical protein
LSIVAFPRLAPPSTVAVVWEHLIIVVVLLMVAKQKSSGESRKTRQGTRTDPDIQLEVERLAVDGWNAAAIHRKLSNDPRFTKRLPVARTIQNLVRAVTPRDPSDPWSLVDSNAEDAELVLPVLAAVAENTEGRREVMTQLEAEWTVRLRRSVPDLPPLWVARLIWEYMLREERKQSTAELDQMLGFAPWRSAKASSRYWDFVSKAHPDWIPAVGERLEDSTALMETLRRGYALRVAVGMSGDPQGQEFFTNQRLYRPPGEWTGVVPEAARNDANLNSGRG